MSFDSWQAFFAMGGYAFYVWMSYAISGLVLGYFMLMPVLHYRQLLRRQKRLQQTENNA